MKLEFDEPYCGYKIRIARTKNGFRGVVANSSGLHFEDTDQDFDRLKARLYNEAGKLDPDYIGIEGAIKRFKTFFHDGGFYDPLYIEMERNYKISKIETLKALQKVGVRSAAKGAIPNLSINMLSSFENARLSELMKSDKRDSFLKASRDFASTQNLDAATINRCLSTLSAAITPFGHASWPMVTLLPFMWEPEHHMFLKPEATKDFANRIGHCFGNDYDSALTAETYFSLLDLTDQTQSDIKSLNPRDRVDVQSFIWVVGNYRDEHFTEMEAGRARL